MGTKPSNNSKGDKPRQPIVELTAAKPPQSFEVISGDAARRLVQASLNPPPPTPELIEMMRKR